MPKPKLIPAAGYARRSTDLQERSIPDQQAYVERWAAEHGYQIIRWFIDDAISGTSPRGRLDFDRMIETAENGRDFDVILCYDISRFSRGGTNETGFYLHRLKTAGVTVLFPADGIPEGEEGELLQGVKSWQARQYSVKLSKDVIRGHFSSVHQKSTQGGRAPYGYDVQYLSKDEEVLKTVRRLPDGSKQEFDANGRFVRVLASNEAPGKAKSDIVRYIPGDPKHIEVVKRIFKLYIEGYGYHSIMRQLNDDGIPGPTGKSWRMTSVRDILTHPVYTGAIVWNRSTGGKIHAVGENGKAESRPNAKRIHRKPKSQWVLIDDVHEPLVSKADFDKVQEILAKRRKAGGAAKPNRRYLLSGLMRCERCGFTFLGRPLGNKQKRYRYYVDGGHHRGGNAICPHRQIPADALEHWVIGQVKSVILGEAETVEAATKAVLKSLKQRTKAEKPSKSLTQEIAAINKRIQGLAAMLADPNLGDLEEIHQTLVDLKKRRDALEEQRCQSARTSRQEIGEPAIRDWITAKIATLEESLANPDATIPARNLMAAFVDRIEIAKEEKRGTLYLITNPAHVFETETSTRVLVGDAALPEYTGYRADVNPGIGNIFSTASYRFGHSMLSPQLLQLDEYGEPTDAGHLALRDAFFRPDYVVRHGIEATLRGLAAQLAQEVDAHLVDDVRNFLFGPPGSGGFDLASLNIQRGRDHGLPDYNSVRLAYGLAPVTSFAEITSSADLQMALEAAYGHVNQIDPWVGGLAEDHLPGGSMGELLTAVLADQFVRLRDGDRFWYQNVLDTGSITEVESTTLADIIRRNTTITDIQDNVFLRADAATDDHGDSAYTASALFTSLPAPGDIEAAYDQDWFTLHTDAGATYSFHVELGSHRDSWLTIYDGDGETILAENDDYFGRASYLEWTADSSGQIFVVVSGYGTQAGTYVLHATRIDDYPDSPECLPESRPAGKFFGQLESPGDVDLIPITVKPGTTYSLNVSSDLTVDVLDASGVAVYARIATGYALESVLWTADDHTDYLLKVRSADSNTTGDYKISVREASFGPGNMAPVIDPISDQSVMHHDRRLLISFRATDAEGGWMWINVDAVCDAEAYQAVSRLQLKPGTSEWYNWGGRQEKWIASQTGAWYFILPDGGLYRWNRLRGAQGEHVADLSATYHRDLGRLFDLRLPNPPRLTITDAFIQVDLPNGYAGEFTVVLRVSDGEIESEELIRVNATANRAPEFAELPNLVLIDGEDALIHVPVNDPDMDPLSYDVQVRHEAYELDQQWGFHTDGDLHENWGGLGEKWFKGSGAKWYFLTDEGNLYRWNRTGQANGEHIATLDTIYHRDINLLLDAVPPQQLASARIEGGMLRIDPRDGAVGTVDLQIGADDGEHHAVTAMKVQLASRNTAPTIAPIADLELFGQDQALIDLQLADADGDRLSITAEIQHFSVAARLSGDLGLVQSDKDFENWGGMGEKWIQGAAKAWYYITPDGSLYRWTASSGMNGALIAELDSAYHADLSLFFRAETSWSPVDLEVVGSSLRVTGRRDFRGFVFVKVTVEDELRLAASTVFRVWIQ